MLIFKNPLNKPFMKFWTVFMTNALTSKTSTKLTSSKPSKPFDIAGVNNKSSFGSSSTVCDL